MVSDDLKGLAIELGVEPLDAEDHCRELPFNVGVACFCIRDGLWSISDGLAILDRAGSETLDACSVGSFAVSKYLSVDSSVIAGLILSMPAW